jgi:hypothetical protein
MYDFFLTNATVAPFHGTTTSCSGLMKELIPDAMLNNINNKIITITQHNKITTGRKLRIYSTVVETNIHYPTDSSLLGGGVGVLARLTSTVKQADNATEELVQDFQRSAQRRVLNIVKFASSTSQTAQQPFKKAYTQLIDVIKQAVNNARTLKRKIVNRAHHLGLDASQVARHVKEIRSLSTVNRIGDRSKRKPYFGGTICC